MAGRGAPGESADARAQEVERAVLDRITPDAATLARVDRTRTALVEAARSEAERRQIPLVRPLVAGSAARGTFLPDRLDIDLFFLFPPDLPRDSLEKHGLALGAAILTDTETRYAEHPYLRGKFEGLRVDAVPGYSVTDPSHPLSAVDRTPFHHEFLAAHQTPGMVDQVRLTKQFLRSLGVYGSEAKTGGFSGYLVELLVLKFGSLRALLRESSGWRPPVRLHFAPDARPRVPDDVSLVLDDPVDPNRNVATALSRPNLATFLLAAAEYLVRPRPGFFEVRPLRHVTPAAARARLDERGSHVAVFSLPRPDLVDDILYPQLRKAERALADEATRLGFAVLGAASAAGRDRVLVLLETEHAQLSPVRVQRGPPPGVGSSERFLERWSSPDGPVLQGPYVGAEGNLAIEVQRGERRLERLLAGALDHIPVGRDLKTGLAQATIEPLAHAEDSEALHSALADLLDKRLPWGAAASD